MPHPRKSAMTENKDNKANEVRQAKKQALAALKARTKNEAEKTKEALLPLRNRVQALIEEYEEGASFEHARRMQKLLQGVLVVVETSCREAEKDLAQISVGGRPCQPSQVRQHLDDLLWDTQ